jgi:serralysin
VIVDFGVGDDIDLSTIDANDAAAGNTAFSFLTASGAAFTGVAGQLRWQNFSSLTLVEGDINGDRVADFQIQLTGSKNLTAVDFIL